MFVGFLLFVKVGGVGFRKLSVGQQSKGKDKLSVLFKINVRREIKLFSLAFSASFIISEEFVFITYSVTSDFSYCGKNGES